MAPKVEKIVESVELGEGPFWDAEAQCLYYVDINGMSIHKYVPQTKKHTWAHIGTSLVSLIIPLEGQKDRFLISRGRDLYTISWDGKSTEVTNMEKIYEIDGNEETLHNRFNDGKCDVSGRLWAGSMGRQDEKHDVVPNKGSFISFGPNKQIKTHMYKIGISNGLTWSLDNKFFYFIDSHTGTVDQFDFDIKNGTISNRKPIFTLKKHNIPGLADGMTIDVDGNLWVAIFGGDRVIKIDPRNPETLLEAVRLPANQVTSLAWGGPNLDQLYVTTAKVTVKGVEYPPPDNGALYVITGLDTKGLPGVKFRL